MRSIVVGNLKELRATFYKVEHVNKSLQRAFDNLLQRWKMRPPLVSGVRAWWVDLVDAYLAHANKALQCVELTLE